MLDVFASVGVTVFDISITDINQSPVPGLQRTRESITQLRRHISQDLEKGQRNGHSVIIRPRSISMLPIQLDDFSLDRALPLEPYAFMTVITSPGNCQVWLAVSDGPKETDKEAAKRFRTRVRRGAGADQSATGATRIAGSINFKNKYAPDFPVITLGQVNAGKTITVAQLEQAGLIAREEPLPLPPASVPQISSPRSSAGRHWPDYQQALRGAPLKGDSTPDRSRADYMFCKWAIERGWSTEETAEKLAEVSANAQERTKVFANCRTGGRVKNTAQ